jgi:hypothetical protein
MVGQYLQDETYNPHEIKWSLLTRWILYTHILKDYISTKMTLDNYNGVTDPRKHVQNAHRNLELAI